MPTKKERREALGRMTKAELVKTVVALDARQTKLLNEIARLRDQVAANGVAAAAMDEGRLDPCEVPGCTAHVVGDAIDSEQEERRRVFGPFPWEQK